MTIDKAMRIIENHGHTEGETVVIDNGYIRERWPDGHTEGNDTELKINNDSVSVQSLRNWLGY